LLNLKGRTISGGFITTTAQSAKFALNLVYTMILARLLMPQDFGLVAMATTVTGFLRVFKDAGLSTATVQREGITHAQVSNLFWINIAVSAVISLTVVAAAPAIAWFYREPRLVSVTLLLSITFLLSGSAVQHQALLSRQMRFKLVALIEVASMLIGYLTGFLMALWGCGYWSLVGSILSMETAGLLLTWSASRWRPQFPARHSGTRPLLKFGANLTAGSFIYSLARGADGLLIGRYFGPDSVGLYSRAAVLLMRPMEQFLGPINAVFVPALSRLQTQPDRYRRTFLQVYEAIALTSFPATGLFFPLAHPLVLVVLGPKWEKAAVIFAGFTMVALYFPLANVSTWLFASQGRGRHWMIATSIVSFLTVASFAAGLPFGPAGVAIAYSVSCLLIQLPLLYYIAGRRGPVSTSDLWMGFLRHLPVWGVVCGATWLTRSLVVDFAPLTQLFVCAPAGLLTGFAFICIFTPSRRVAISLFSILRELKTAREPAAT
jgi:PST family polysaccharide transporter